MRSAVTQNNLQAQLFNIKIHKPLHCRILFHPHPRKKDPCFSHLSLEDIKSLVEKIVVLINQFSCEVRFGFSVISGSGHIYPIDERPNVPEHEYKKTLHQLGSACFLPLKEKYINLLAGDFCEVFISSDTISISFKNPLSPVRKFSKHAHYFIES